MIATWPGTGEGAWALGRTRAVTVPAYVLVPICLGVALLPLLKPSGPGNTSPVDAFFAVAIGATILWAGYAGQDLRLPYALAVGLLMLGGAIGSLAGPFPDLGLLALVQDFILLIWCAVLVNTARSPAAFQWILRAWAWSSIAWAALLVLAVASGNYALAGITDRTGVRAALTFGDPNYAANYFFVSLMILMAARTPRHLGLRLAGAALLVVALGLTGSNGGILATAIGLGVVFLFYAGRRWGPMAVVAAGGIAAAGAVIALLMSQALPLEVWARDSGIPLLRDSFGRSSQSAQERAWLIQEMTALYQQGAPWGLGPGSTKPLLQTELAPYAYQTHNDYLEAIVERGFIGAFGLLVLMGAVGVRTWAVVTRPLAPEFAALFPRTSPLVGAAVGLAVSASYYQILHFRHVWTLLAIVAALFLWARSRA